MSRVVVQSWTVGPYTFQEVKYHGFTRMPELMYQYLINGERVENELYATLDRAIVAAVGAKHTGPRGANGPGVGTAADWFMRMIGADHIEEIPAPQCSGSGRTWALSSGAPVCPACRKGPNAMDAEAPRRVRVQGGWSSPVPDHPPRER